MTLCEFRNVRNTCEVTEITLPCASGLNIFKVLNVIMYTQVKIILFLLGWEGKIKILRGYCGGTKAWASVLSLKPHLLVRVRPRRKKHLGKPHSSWMNREMFKGISPRGSSSLDLTNVSKVKFVLTWVTFQEAPAMKIDFRCTGKG